MELITRYCHGYVAIPVIIALEKQRLFDYLIERGGLTLEELTDHFHANEGHLNVALNLLLSLGWVEKGYEGEYVLTEKAADRHYIPESLLSIYRMSPNEYLMSENFQTLVNQSMAHYGLKKHSNKSLLIDMLDGAVITPLLLALSEKGIFNLQKRKLMQGDLSEMNFHLLTQLFTKCGWIKCDNEQFDFTIGGSYLFDRIYNLAAVVSYRVLLHKMDSLLFGDVNDVFGADEQGFEKHVDRQMNVIGSGSQHQLFFENFKINVLKLFSNEDFSNQPMYIADMGCGDGELLKTLYHAIITETPRGQVLEAYPLTMIGADFNEVSLFETAKTLTSHEVPYLTIKADVGNPKQFILDLQEKGIDPNKILHVRSFLDHDRPYIAPDETNVLVANKIAQRKRYQYEGVFVDKHGKKIAPEVMMQSLVEHMGRWGSINVGHGLMTLEVHYLSPQVVRQYIDESENIHFDAYHGFSKQFLVKIEDFIMACAENGLFVDISHFNFLSQEFPFFRVSSNRFEQKEYRIRYACLEDLESLIQLEQLCWSAELQSDSRVVRHRLETYPRGQYILELNNTIIGVIYTQCLSDIEEIYGKTERTIGLLHDANGSILHLLGMFVHPDYHETGYGQTIRDFALLIARITPGINNVVGVTRCQRYEEYQERYSDIRDYINAVDETGLPLDSTLGFHVGRGATIEDIIENYRPRDKKNKGVGILIRYDLDVIFSSHPRPIVRKEKASFPQASASHTLNLTELTALIYPLIQRQLPQGVLQDFDPNTPLMSFGIDSLGLTQLRRLISQVLAIELTIDVFFNYPTPIALANYLVDHQLSQRAGSSSLLDSSERDDIKISPMAKRSKARKQQRAIEQRKEKAIASKDEVIAITGAALRFPQASSLQEYWELMQQDQDAISLVPLERWNRSKIVGRASSFGGFIDRIEYFDADFFGISAAEAKQMDPQQRLLLEVTWHALESAGINPEKLKGQRVGIFIGQFSHDYELLQAQASASSVYYATGNSSSVSAGRLSFFLGSQGPTITLDTACSSSLVAVHLAQKSLQHGECDVAIVGGVNAILAPQLQETFTQSGMLASDGHCKTFDNSANGYVRGEGCGVVVLQRLEEAQANQHNVLAVIKGSAINHDGQSNGLTAPNGLAQEALIQLALADADVQPHDIDYLEAHGTGTSLGDPIELNAIRNVFTTEESRKSPLIVGTAKTYIGHLEAAAGIAGLIKTVLSLRYQKIPKLLHFQHLNTNVSLNENISLAEKAQDWKSDETHVRRAGISSFGFSGTNAHIILEEAPQAISIVNQQENNEPQLLVLSAKTLESLNSLKSNYVTYLKETTNRLVDIAYTSAVGRSHFQYRIAIIAQSKENLISQLEDASIVRNTNNRTLNLLAGSYLAGENVDWENYYAQFDEVYRRVALPEYVFQRQRYWLDETQDKDTYYEHTWQLSESDTPYLDSIPTCLWLIADETQAQAIEKKYSNGLMILANGQYKHLSISKENIWQTSENIIALLTQWLETITSPVQVIVHWQYLASDLPASPVMACQKLLQSLLSTTQLLFKTKSSIKTFVLWSQGAFADNLAQAGLSGFMRSLSQELTSREIQSCHIDTVMTDTDAEQWQALNAELARGITEREIRYISGQRHIGRLTAHPFVSSEVEGFSNQTILITGGLRGLGLEVAKFFVTQGVKNLILVGRQAPAHDVADLIAQWQSQAIKVTVFSCDISDEPAVENLFQQIVEININLTGIVHAAGLIQGGFLEEKSWQSFEAVLKPKLAAWYLHNYSLRYNFSLNYFVTFSSISSTLGYARQIDYAAANSFMDELVAYRRRQGLSAQSIHWGPWADVGMVKDEHLQAFHQAEGFNSFNTGRGMALFAKAIASASAAPVIIDANWQQVAQAHPAMRHLLSEVSNVSLNTSKITQLSAWHNHLISLSREKRALAMTKKLIELVTQIRGVETHQVETQCGFTAMGFGSFMMIELQNRVQKLFGHNVVLSPTLVFDYSNIDELSHYLLQILQLEKQSSAVQQNAQVENESIAIIAAHGYFPRAGESLEDYWALFSNEQDASDEISHRRFSMDRDYSSQRGVNDKSYVKRASLLNIPVDEFDASFFNISPKEACYLDPQQRLLLEVVWGALEAANIPPSQLRHSATGVFIGISEGDYARLIAQSEKSTGFSPHALSGSALNMASGRLSYWLGCQGPALSIDTACSSSLVALHQAINSLRAGDCNMAIVGGVNVILSANNFIRFSQANMLSPDGICKTFDEKADGYGRGEGCGVVILKSLSQAQADNDTILAMIRGSAVNQDGPSSGLTVPNGPAQEQLVLRALDQAGLSPNDIDYIEAHGTGTSLGDPIELNAIYNVFTTAEKRRLPLMVGTAKTNIGHLEAAAGIAGLIKTILSLQNNTIPKLLHFTNLNPKIHLGKTLQLPVKARAWKTSETHTRRAGISSFGFSGTNAHVILEEAPISTFTLEQEEDESPQIILISAKTPEALKALKNKYAVYLSHTTDRLQDIAYTSAVGRDHFKHRVAVVANNKQALIAQLENTSLVIEEVDHSLALLAKAYVTGENIDWKKYYVQQSLSYHKVNLPKYAFQRKRYWVEEIHQLQQVDKTIHPLLGHFTCLPDGGILYQQSLDAISLRYLQGHQVMNVAIMPGAAFLEIMLSAGSHASFYLLHTEESNSDIEVQESHIETPLVLNDDYWLQTQVTVDEDSQHLQIKIYSRHKHTSEVRLHVQGKVRVMEAVPVVFASDMQDIKERCDQRIAHEDFYPFAASLGFDYQTTFQVIDTILYNKNEAIVFLKTQEENVSGYYLPPALFDGILQTILITMLEHQDPHQEIIRLPVGFNELSYSGDKGGLTSASQIHVQWILDEAGLPTQISLTIYDAAGECRCQLKELKTQAVPCSQLQAYFNQLNRSQAQPALPEYYETAWQVHENDGAKIIEPLSTTWLINDEASSEDLSIVQTQQVVLYWKYLLSDIEAHDLSPVDACQSVLKKLLTITHTLFSTNTPLKRFVLWSQNADEDLTQAGLSGFMRSLSLELALRGIACCHIDTHSRDSLTQQQRCVEEELSHAWTQSEIRYRHGKRYVSRLKTAESVHSLAPKETGPYMLVKSNSGLIDELHLARNIGAERVLQANELRVQLKAAGLNFRDVLNAMNLYPGNAVTLGGDFAGVVTEVGSALVDHYCIGDKVLGMGNQLAEDPRYCAGSLSSEMIIDGRLALKQPGQLNHTECAGLPVVFLTSQEALIKRASLKAGEKVLIHTATGGIGLSAIQIAQHIGADIYATAGSERKRDYLRSLGIQHVYDSRSLDYGQQILHDTNNVGVDVVLNTLTGPGYIETSLKACAKDARFIEISKRDIWTAEQIHTQRSDIVYTLLALDEMLLQDLGYMQVLWAELYPLFEAKVYHALPYEHYSITQAKEAFHAMQRAEHIGKIVISLVPEYQEKLKKQAGSFLITGGLRGLGFEVAKHLVAQGMQSLILVGRQAPSIEAEKHIQQWRTQGVEIILLTCDISDETAVASMFDDFSHHARKLCGIIHAAGVIQDNYLEKQTWTQFEAVLKPKLAAWYLHHYSQQHHFDLDYFITFSSIASTLGSMGQTNYAAANSFIDALVAHRRRQGLSGQSIHWGPWADVGMASDERLKAFHRSSGFHPFSTARGVALFEKTMLSASASPVVVDADWHQVVSAHKEIYPFLEVMLSHQPNTIKAKTTHNTWIREAFALSGEARYQAVKEKLKILIAQVSQLQVHEINDQNGFTEMGFDSLMMVELKNRIQQFLGSKITLSSTLLFDYPNLRKLTQYIVENIFDSTEEIRVKPSKLSKQQDRASMEPIAVVGMSGRFPGMGTDLGGFWQTLATGENTTVQVPEDRWSTKQYYAPGKGQPGKSYTQSGSFLQSDVKQFDAGFFNISPKEANYLDPQHRLLMEVVYEALESAHIPMESLSESDTGIYMGIATHDYAGMISQLNSAESHSVYTATGNAFSTAAGRIAFWLGSQGPTMSIETACSSSLVALHQACQSIRQGETNMAIVGGVNLLLSADNFVIFSQAEMLAEDGKCKTFDAAADGYGRGEGCGVVILKRLSEAQADNDNILAVIRGSAVNQDGKSSGLTVPNGPAQEKLMRSALRQAHLSPNDIDYIEAHGTGTKLGDPIELNAIQNVFAGDLTRTQPLIVGTAKTYVGHLEAAAGIVGFIKTVLSLQHDYIPQLVNFQHLNPNIQLNPQLHLPVKPHAWPKQKERVRRAGVSSFGFSGTNAHVILEEAPRKKHSQVIGTEQTPQIILLSAKTEEALLALKEKYIVYLDSTEASLADIAYSSAIGRTHFMRRVAIIAGSKEELIEKLQSKAVLIEEKLTELHGLANAYVAGESIHWKEYYTKQRHHYNKVDLPTYAFQRKSYWLDVLEKAEKSQQSLKHCYETVMVQKTLLDITSCFLPVLGFFQEEALAVAWQSQMARKCHIVLTDGRYKLFEQAWQSTPGNNYFEALSHVFSLEEEIQVVYGASLSEALQQDTITVAHENLYRNIKSLYDFCSYLLLALPEKIERLCLLSQGDIAYGPAPQLAKSGLNGWAKSLSAEYPILKISQIDLDPAIAINAQWSGIVIELNLSKKMVENEVVYRNEKRFVTRLQVASPGAIEREIPFSLTTESFLITGGLRGLGFEIARWLVEQKIKQLILVGRTLPDLETQAAIEAWQATGIKILVITLDVTQLTQIDQLFMDLKQQDNIPTGIIHAAGVLHDGFLKDQTWQNFETVLAPKLAAGYLHESAQRHAIDLRYFIVFSSIASVFGNAGQLNYAVANAFMDNLIQYRRGQGLSGQSIHWGPWADTGMAKDAGLIQYYDSLGLQAFSTQEGIALFEKALRSSWAEPIMLNVDWPKWTATHPTMKPFVEFMLNTKLQNTSENQPNLWLQNLSRVSKEECHAFLELQIKGWVAKISHFGIDEVEVTRGFTEMGFDSLLMMSLRNQIQQALGEAISLSTTLIFDYPTIKILSDYLTQEIIRFNQNSQPSDSLNTFVTQAPLISAIPTVADNEPIAIIGMGLRFPGDGSNITDFWEMLARGENTTTDIPQERWPAQSYYSETKGQAGKTYTQKASFIHQNIKEFDAHFFNMSPKETNYLDPQQRLLLEVVWEALEAANINPEQLNESDTGVYVGITSQDYSQMIQQLSASEACTPYTASGSSFSTAAGRIAYFLGSQGPTMSIDTACSSSLVALNQAIENMHAGKCQIAIVGGVNLLLSPRGFVSLSQANMLSTDGTCKAFDEDADGYGRSEGCGVIVLKRLSVAQENNDTILAVIRGSAINQDGRSSGLTVPNGPAQEKLMRAALENARLSPNDIDYLEAHGTGTSLGDPIELNAIRNIYTTAEKRKASLMIGTVKTNIGHLEAAAGMAGLIKTVLSLQHQFIPRLANFKQLNPLIQLNDHVQLALETQPWNRNDDHVRRAAISSFGFSGTNAHVILEEAPKDHRIYEAYTENNLQLLVFSAKTEVALQALKEKYIAYLGVTENSLPDIAYTSAIARSHFDYRIAVTAKTKEELIEKLASTGSVEKKSSTNKKITFLFTGQGSQYANMGKELYETQPVFQRSLNECAFILNEELPHPFYSVLFGEHKHLLNQTQYAQPLLFSLEYALAKLWISWGVIPQQMLGHSVGEFAAATIAGVMTLPEAIKLVAARARLMQALPDKVGGMMAIQLSHEETQVLLNDFKLSVAGINAPKQTVVSGSKSEISRLATLCEKKKIRATPLAVSHAFHSQHMLPMLEEFKALAQTIDYQIPKISLVSTVTGELLTEINAEYWCEQLVRPVNFLQAIRTTTSEEPQLYLEVGPSPVLITLGQQCLDANETRSWCFSVRPGKSNHETVLVTLSHLYVAGHAIDWKKYYLKQPYHYKKVSLPTYAFQRKRYWVEGLDQLKTSTQHNVQAVHPLLGTMVQLPEGDMFYQRSLSDESLRYLLGHQIMQTAIMPGAAFMEMILSAGRHAMSYLLSDENTTTIQLQNVRIDIPLVLNRNCMLQTRVTLDKEKNVLTVMIYSRHTHSPEALIHAQGILRCLDFMPSNLVDLASIERRCDKKITGEVFYPKASALGFDYFDAFNVIDYVIYNDHEAVVSLKALENTADYHLHPAGLDGLLQASMVTMLHKADETEDSINLPVGVQELVYSGKLGGLTQTGHIHLQWERDAQNSPINLQIAIYDLAGECSCYLINVQTKATKRSQLRTYLHQLSDQSEVTAAPDYYEQIWQVSEHAPLKSTITRASHWLLTYEMLIESVPIEMDTVVVYWKALTEGIEGLSPVEACEQLLHGLLTLTQTLIVQDSSIKRFVLWSEGAHCEAPAQTGFVGFMRSLSLELAPRGIECCHVDMDPCEPSEKQRTLMEAVLEFQVLEREYRYHHGQCYVGRLSAPNMAMQVIPNEEGAYTLVKGTVGLIDELHLELNRGARRSLSAHELRIQVKASGLNFRDVLNVMNLYPGDAGPLGGDFAGVVTEVGSGVLEHFTLGDRVFGMGVQLDEEIEKRAGSLSSEIIVDARIAVKQPSRLSYTESAGLGTIFLTSYEALIKRAHLKKGERVLIHTATGGIGLSAIQVAQAVGAEIYATAGSERKRDYLRSLGIQHIYDSRSLDYGSAILRDTDQQGVEVVLNTLTGKGFIETSLNACARNARFIEISKRDVWTEAEVQAYRQDITYTLLALDAMLVQDPTSIQSLWAEILPKLKSGIYHSIRNEHYTLTEVKEAFKAMQHAEHMGKVVISLAPEYRPILAKRFGAFLVTGGLRGLGFEVAKSLVSQGAGSLILIGRQAPSDEVKETIQQWQTQGIHIIISLMDISDAQAIEALFQNLADDSITLRGIVHAAGVIHDHVFEKQSWTTFEAVLKPKLAAWYLHEYSQQQGWDLEYFIMFSSIASTLGNVGQINYAAANSFMDGLIEYRRAKGLSGQTMHWGPWAEIGMAKDKGLRALHESVGFHPFTTARGMELFEKAMLRQTMAPVLIDVNWTQLVGTNKVFERQLENILSIASITLEKQTSNSVWLKGIVQLPTSQRVLAIEKKIASLVASVGKFNLSEVDHEIEFTEMGLDSLMTAELINLILSALDDKITLSSIVLFQYPTLKKLSAYIAEQLTSLLSTEIAQEKVQTSYVASRTLMEKKLTPLFETQFSIKKLSIFDEITPKMTLSQWLKAYQQISAEIESMIDFYKAESSRVTLALDIPEVMDIEDLFKKRTIATMAFYISCMLELQYDAEDNPLFTCVKKNNRVTAESVLSKTGVTINDQDAHGKTSLHLSVQLDYEEMTLWLIQHGASLNIKTELGVTPFALILYSQQFELAEELVRSSQEIVVDEEMLLIISNVDMQQKFKTLFFNRNTAIEPRKITPSFDKKS